jgi:hypothetical protein
MRLVFGDCGTVGVSGGRGVGVVGREGGGGSVETVVWVDCLRSMIGKGVVGEDSTASSVISSDDMMEDVLSNEMPISRVSHLQADQLTITQSHNRRIN